MNHRIPALVPVHDPSRTVTPGEITDLYPNGNNGAVSSFQSISMWGPVLAAILLDLADVLSFGPQGVFIGIFAGSALGWRIASASGFSSKGRLICAALAAIYCMVPFTELLPLATMLTTASRVMSALSLLRRARGG